MKRILVPTDFSKHAEYALKVAAQIAKKNDGEIFLVHMLELPTSGNDALSRAHDIPELMFFKNAAVAKLDELMNADYLDGVKISRIIQFEMAFDGIIKNGEAHNVDLIVMGSHGASGFQEMFIGSNAEKVVSPPNTPVIKNKPIGLAFNQAGPKAANNSPATKPPIRFAARVPTANGSQPG